jgi:hypothetical protein
MNIWNYRIERKVKTSFSYKQWTLAIWEEIVDNKTVDNQYYVTPPVTLIQNSAVCEYKAISKSFAVMYEVQFWEHELPRAAVEALKKMSVNVLESQIYPLPFYQARIVWNNPEEELQGLKLTSAWTNNLQQQKSYRFRVAAESNETCQLLAQTIRSQPEQFSDSIQLQFTVSAAKIASKSLTVESRHIVDNQMVASLKNMAVEGSTRYLTSDDFNRMVLQVANEVMASEIKSGDYVDTEDEVSFKDVVAKMFDMQHETTAQFEDKMWDSVFWNPLDSRPDKVSSELNKVLTFNETDNRFYQTSTSSGTSNAKVNAVLSFLKFGGSGSHSSSSSATSDEMAHALAINDVQVEIKGEKFVPKTLNLARLNLNSLTRQDALATKRVRVSQVDIGGRLQVAIGNSTGGQIVDENRFLREQLDEMKKQQANMQGQQGNLQNQQQSLQTELNSVKNAVIPGIQQSLQTDINGLKASSIKGCRVCFQETEGNDQCQGVRNSCSGWSNGGAAWTLPYKDDTDNRAGTCTYQWKVECTS